MPDPSGQYGNSLTTNFGPRPAPRDDRAPSTPQVSTPAPRDDRAPASTGQRAIDTPRSSTPPPSSTGTRASVGGFGSSLAAGANPRAAMASQDDRGMRASLPPPPMLGPSPFDRSLESMALINRMNSADRRLLEAAQTIQDNVGGPQRLTTSDAITGADQAARTSFGETGPRWGNNTPQGRANIAAVQQVILNRIGLAINLGQYGGSIPKVLRGFDANGYDTKRVSKVGIGPKGNPAFQKATFGSPEYERSIQLLSEVSAGRGPKLPSGVKNSTNYRAYSISKPSWGAKGNPKGYKETTFGPHLFSNPDPGREPQKVHDTSASRNGSKALSDVKSAYIPVPQGQLPALPPPIPPPVNPQVASGNGGMLKSRVTPDGRLETYVDNGRTKDTSRIPQASQSPQRITKDTSRVPQSLPPPQGLPAPQNSYGVAGGFGMLPYGSSPMEAGATQLAQDYIGGPDDGLTGYGQRVEPQVADRLPAPQELPQPLPPRSAPQDTYSPQEVQRVAEVAEKAPNFFQRVLADLQQGRGKDSSSNSGMRASDNYLQQATSDDSFNPLEGLSGDAAVRMMLRYLAKGKDPFAKQKKSKTT